MSIKRLVVTCAVFSSVFNKKLFFPNFKISENSSVTGNSEAELDCVLLNIALQNKGKKKNKPKHQKPPRKKIEIFA